MTRCPDQPLDEGDGIDQRQQSLAVVHVGGGHVNDERRPWPSIATRCLTPALPRSVGFGPVSAPPKRLSVRAVDEVPRPVDRLRLVKPSQQDRLQFHPHGGSTPVAQSPPAGHAAQPELRRQLFPPDPHFKLMRIPSSTARCDLGGRPPPNFRTCFGGGNGSINVHNSSDTSSRAIPPLRGDAGCRISRRCCKTVLLDALRLQRV